ncbi:DgyrCDS1714 [Dimorphilus gyrociliatus]|uniref:DgyrCDS1714 n=1 Tax=Dimorphilus gyrociliatus TaxID=2664684 RepID=A0A7I8V891_9ANNE|nr:DgyrCDS1714 [Dimorphilus gyrociliatus]
MFLYSPKSKPRSGTMSPVSLFFAILCVIYLGHYSTAEEKHYDVTTIPVSPYISYLNEKKLVGNAQFEGYLIDLLEKLAKFGNFTYSLRKVQDRKYGQKKNGEWDGMIGELVNRKADMALAPLTRSDLRAAAVLFTIPFRNVNLNFLVRKNFKEKKIDELAKDKNVKFFVIKGGTTSTRFKFATDPVEKRIWRRLQKTDSESFISTVKQGVDKVLEDNNVVFIVESPMAEYWENKNCDLKILKDVIETKDYYSLAVRKDLIGLKDTLDLGLWRLNQGNELKKLWVKWFSYTTCSGSMTKFNIFGLGVTTLIIMIIAL